MPTKSKQQHKKQTDNTGLERIIFIWSFVAIGLIFLSIGLYSMLLSSDSLLKITELFKNFFQPSTDQTAVVSFTTSSLGSLLLYFVPGILILLLSIFFARKYRTISYSLILIISAYFVFVQLKLFANVFLGGCVYDYLYQALIFLFLTVSLLLIAAYVLNKSAVLILSCLYLYLTSALYILTFHDGYEVLLILMLLFGIATLFIEKRIASPRISLTNYIFATGFYALFFIRKFVVNSKPEFLHVFFLTGGLFYLVFYIIPVFLTRTKDKKFSLKGFRSVIVGSNLLVYIGTTAYVLLKYYNNTVLSFYAPIFLLVNLAVVYLISKYKPTTWQLPYHYTLIFLSALILPLWLQDSRLFLFGGALSVLMLGYAVRWKDKIGFWISLSALGLAVLSYLFSWLVGYIPVIVWLRTLTPYVMWRALLSSIALLALLWGTKKIVKSAVLPVSEEIFTAGKYIRVLNICLFSVLFLTVGWALFVLLKLLTGSVNYSVIGWYISGSLFFISLISYFSGKYSPLKKTTHYAGLVFALLYPVFSGLNTYFCSFIQSGTLDIRAILLHYAGLILFVLLSAMVVKRVKKRYNKKMSVLRVIQFVSIVYLGYLLLAEYDNISLIINHLRVNTGSLDSASLNKNYFFPYSIVFSVYATVIYLYALLKQNKLLRLLSFAFIILCLIKIFLLDIESIPDANTGAIYACVGIYLVGFAILNTLFVKPKTIEKERPKLK